MFWAGIWVIAAPRAGGAAEAIGSARGLTNSATPTMLQFHRHLRRRTMMTNPQPFAQPFSDRRVAPAGPRPATRFPGWGPKI
jgi:hypothetical protein